MTYKGHKHILVNKTNDCMTDTMHWAEMDGAIRSQTCRDSDDQLHNLGSMYSADSCSTEALHLKQRISTYEINGIHHIYCYPFNITIGSNEFCCPDHVFQLEGRMSYSIANFNHIGRYVERSIMKDVDFLINKRVMMKLRLDDTKISTMKISGLNITQKLNSSLSTYIGKLKDIPTNLNLTSSSFIPSNPFAFLEEFFSSIMSTLKILGYIIVIIIVGMIALTVSPLLGFAVMIVQSTSYILRKWARRLTTRWNHKIEKKFFWEKKEDCKSLV